MTVIHRVTAIYRAVIYRFDCILVLWVSFSSYAYYFGLLALTKSVILGSFFALFGAKYVRPSPQENKNPNNFKATVLK